MISRGTLIPVVRSRETWVPQRVPQLAVLAKKAHLKLKGIRDNAHRHVARHLCEYGLVAFGDINVHSVMSNNGNMAKKDQEEDEPVGPRGTTPPSRRPSERNALLCENRGRVPHV